MSSDDGYPGRYRVVEPEATVGDLARFRERERIRRRREVNPFPARIARQRPLGYLEWDGITPCHTLDEAFMRYAIPEIKRLVLAARPDEEADERVQQRYRNSLATTFRTVLSYGDTELADWLLRTHEDLTVDLECLRSTDRHPTHDVVRFVLDKYRDRFVRDQEDDEDVEFTLDVVDYPLAPDLERAGLKVWTRESLSVPIPRLRRAKSEGRPVEYLPPIPDRKESTREPARMSALYSLDEYVDSFTEVPSSDTGCRPLRVLQTGDLTVIKAMFEAARVEQTVDGLDTDAIRDRRKSNDVLRDDIDNMQRYALYPPRVLEYLCARAASGVGPHEMGIVSRFIAHYIPFPKSPQGLIMAHLVPMALEALGPIDLALVHRDVTDTRLVRTAFRGGTRHKPLEFRGDNSIEMTDSFSYKYATKDFNFVFDTTVESVRLLLRVHETDQGNPYKISRADTLAHRDTFFHLVQLWFRPLMTHPDAPYEPAVEQDFEIEYHRLLESMIED